MASAAEARQKDTVLRYRVTGMDCAACANKIGAAIRRVPGVTDVVVSVTSGVMAVHHDRDTMPDAEVQRQVKSIGYGIGRQDAPDERTGTGQPGAAAPTWWKNPKLRLTTACGMALIVAYGVASFTPAAATWVYVVAMTIGLIPISYRAFTAARAGTLFSIEMLMTIAAMGAIIIGATEEAAAVVFLFLVGELLEGVATGRARASIRNLVKLVPKTAHLQQAGSIVEIPAAQLTVDDCVLVRPGDRIPADGIIVSGNSSINEAPITGESTPKQKGTADTVFAGTINLDGSLSVRVTATAADNTIARIVRMVEYAQEAKAPTERFIDRFSRYYTPIVVLVAVLVSIIPPLFLGALWNEWVYKGLAILLIGCPCALVISTPAAIAAALAAGARRGLLLKGGVVLEQVGKITIAAFDKTGTLTAGQPQVTNVLGVDRSESETLRLAASLESGSSHPLAAAILSRAVADGIAAPPATEGAAVAGKGITGNVGGVSLFLGSIAAASDRVTLPASLRAQTDALQAEGKTISVLLAASKLVGVIAMRDEPRGDAGDGLAALIERGVKAIMLTGDNEATAVAIGKTLGIEVRAGLLPQDKQTIVTELQKAGNIVAKIGDGINDAPALAAADVGIAMGGGTDVAIETADAAILHGRVSDVAAMFDLSRRTMANVRQNITVALGLKAVFLGTTVAGITGLWPAILADTGATVLVTLNALRLLR
ncbi:MAG: heavy metal translocating P-type ATPase [Gammaproteobacteria bacterium]